MDKKSGLRLRQNDRYISELAAAYRNIPSPVRSSSDMTAEVLSRLSVENEALRNSRHVPNLFKRTMFTRVAVLLCLFALVGGTCYAAYSGYMLPLRDKSGHTALQVAPTDIPSAPVEEERILTRVRDGLKEGEQAVVYIGNKAIQEQTGELLPQKGSHYSIVVKPREFDNPQLMNEFLLTHEIQMELPLSSWKGWSLNRTELQNDILNKGTSGYEWKFAHDEQSGLNYKYAIGPSSKNPHSLSWYYSNKQNEEIMLTVPLNIPILPIFYDSNPSSDSILSIKGVDAYFYKDKSGSERSIQWSEKIEEGNYRLYAVVTHTANDSDLRKFAAAVISNQQQSNK